MKTKELKALEKVLSNDSCESNVTVRVQKISFELLQAAERDKKKTQGLEKDLASECET